MVSKEGERNKAIVTYWADPNSAATNDAFSFAVRYRGGRYSSTARFDIDLEGEGALSGGGTIEVTPSSADFGKVSVGNEEVREIFVKNKGNTVFNRQIILYSPWHVLEPARGQLSLSPGASAKVKIAFRPTLIGEANYVLGLSRSKEGLCKLKAEALDPFTFSTKEAELILNPKTNRREAEIGVINSSEKPILLGVLASSRLQLSVGRTFALMPGKETKVKVHLPENDVSAFEGGLELGLENGYGKSVTLFAKTVPGRIEIEVPDALSSEVINFGQVGAGQAKERGILIKNVGGEVVPLEFEVPEPFRLMSRPIEQLAPRAQVPFSIGLYPGATRKGAVDVTMKVMSDTQVVPLRLLGNVIKPKAGFRMSSSPRSSQPNQLPPATPATTAPPAGISSSQPAVPSGVVNRVQPPVPLTPGTSAPATATPPKPNGLMLDDSKPGTVVKDRSGVCS